MVPVRRIDIAQYLPRLAVDFHNPSIGAGWFIPWLGPDPQCPVAYHHRGHHAEIVPLAEIFTPEIESL